MLTCILRCVDVHVQRRKDKLLADWDAECEALKARKEAALVAKSQAESDYANARTQQQAERAERAIKDSIAYLKVWLVACCMSGILMARAFLYMG